MKALLLVDIQNDFLPGGALAVPCGDEVVPVANAAIRHFRSTGALVVATQDYHPANHQSFASQHSGRAVGDVIDLDDQSQVLWPDHCVQGTPGCELAPGLETSAIHQVFRKGMDPRLDSYSGFFDNGHHAATGLGDYLHQRRVEEVYVMGLATDYCVKFTALDAVELGFATRLIVPGVRGVNLEPGDTEAALRAMTNAGVELLTSLPWTPGA
jgi:nicotinamidase/pyrazinamidase